jgi:hypothetical protein
LFAAKVARLSCGLAVGAGLCAELLVSRRACAQDLHPTLLAYKASADCPLVGDFQRSVQRRSARIHFVDEGSHERELAIVLRKNGDFTVGELRLIEANGTLRQRSVRFTTCAEAVDGLALIATVSLDPQALLESPGPVPQTSSPAPAPPPAQPAHAEPARRPAASPPAPPVPRKGAPTDAKVGVDFNAYFNALPKAAIGGSIVLDLESNSRHLFAPTFLVSATRVERLGIHEVVQPPGGGRDIFDANFALSLLALSVCPLRIGGDVLVFRPCAFASGGLLSAWATETARAQSNTRGYASWGGAGMLSIRLGEVVEIVGDAGVGLTLIRDQFGFEAVTFWTTPVPYVLTGLGFRLALP